jgi:hypothetical protein
MKDTEWGWVSKQLAGTELDEATRDAVVYVLETLRKQDLTDDQERAAMNAAVKLAAGHSIAVEKPNERWGPVVPGAYQIKDIVRVKSNAFEGDIGRKHNGKQGRVVASRNGFVMVVLDDSPSSEIQMRYKPEHLERKIV